MTALQVALAELDAAYAARDAELDRAADEVTRQFAPIIKGRQMAYARARIDAAAEPNCS